MTVFPPSAFHCLLSAADARELDRAAIAKGMPGFTLMRRAGESVAAIILEKFSIMPCLVLCGPGNNGGDGFIIAETLRRADWPVRTAMLTREDRLHGDAALARVYFQGEVLPWSADLLDGAGLLVDTMFGTGLDRPLSQDFIAAIDAVNARDLPVIAVDMPSGIHADSGAVMGAAIRARMTVTFTARKTGLALSPGRAAAGDIVVRDIGLDADAVAAWRAGGKLAENHPGLWRAALPPFLPEQHKYDHGHALILGGAVMTGAARLAARAAQRVGTGLVTIAAPPEAAVVYATNLDSVLVVKLSGPEVWPAAVAGQRISGLLLGPGAGVGEGTRAAVLAALATGKPCVLDADALTRFAENPEDLFEHLHARCVLTPHTGEFARLFGAAALDGGRLLAAQNAAGRAKAVVLLKGAETVIAAPDGRRAVINANAPPWLATGGTGDVLAGMIAGLMAQGMEAFQAACAAAWLHGAAAAGFAPGMIAEDLVAALPPALAAFKNRT